MPIQERENQTMIGRKKELDAIVECLSNAWACPTPLIIVSGPEGIGKTRLVNEAIKEIQKQDVTVVKVNLQPNEQFPYRPFRDTFTQLRKNSNAAKNPFLDPRALSSKDGLIVASREFLAEICETRPVLIVIEDLDLVDSSSVRLIEYLVRTAEDKGPFLLCTLNRKQSINPDDATAQLMEMIDSTSSDGLCKIVRLERMSDDETNRIVAGMFQEQFPKSLSEKISRASEGNPLTATEMARLLNSDGSIVFKGGVWKPADSVTQLTTLEDAVRKRLTKLDGRERACLEQASALRDGANISLLGKVAGTSTEDMSKLLEQAGRKTGLILLQEGQIHCTHERVRACITNQMPEERKVRTFEMLADAIVSEGYGEERLGELSYLYTAVGNVDKGIEFSLLAGKACRFWHSNPEIKEYYDRVIALIPKLSGSKYGLESWEAIGDAEFGMERWKQASAAYDAAMPLASSADKARLLRKKSECWSPGRLGKDAQSSLSYILQALIEAGDDQETAECKSRMAEVVAADGDMEGAMKLSETAEKMFRDLNLMDLLAREKMQRGSLLLRQGNVEKAIEVISHAIRISEEYPDLENEIDASEALGMAYLCKGGSDRAVPVFDRCIELAAAIGDRERIRAATFDKTFAYNLAGETTRARETIEASEKNMRQAGGTPVWQRVALAHLEQRSGNLDAAGRLAEDSLAQIDTGTKGDDALRSLIMAIKASVLSQRKDYAQSNDLFRKVMPTFRGIKFGLLYEATVHAWFAESLAEQGENSEAEAEFEKARNLFAGFGNKLTANVLNERIRRITGSEK